MMQTTYRKEGDQYAIYVGEHLILTTPEVALMVNKNGYLLVNHGPVEEVNKRHLQLLKVAARQTGHGDIADQLVVISGQFDVEELNCIINRKQSVRALYSRLELKAARDATSILAKFAQLPQQTEKPLS